MSVTDIVASIGSWEIKLKQSTPQDILDKLQYFGHIAISSGHVDPEDAGDNLLTSARYVGVVRERNFGDENNGLKGPGMAVWLADEDKKGDVIEAPGISFDQSTFTNAVTQLLPDSVKPGIISPLTGFHTQTYLWQTPRQALDYLTSLYDAEWRVNGDASVDVGSIEDLYVTEPRAAVVRNRYGPEMHYRALPGRSTLDSDTADFTTRVVMLQTSEEEGSTVTGFANILPELNPYKDLFGNEIEFTRIIEETQTDATNGTARAQLQLNRFTSPRDALKLTTQLYDIQGEIEPGDYVWVYDPTSKLQDLNNELYFQGEAIHPIKLRVFQLTWPVEDGMGIAYRGPNGEWVDLTDYVIFEDGTTDVVVGGYNRSLTGSGSSTDPVGSIPTTNTSKPNAPTWNQPFDSATYQSDADGLTRAQVTLAWDKPLNTDGSVINDGAFYEIRHRTSATTLYPPTHEEMGVYKHEQLTGAHQSTIPFAEGQWSYRLVSFDYTSSVYLDLTPGLPYDFQIRALDNAKPPNTSDWSDNAYVQTRPDTTAPSTPAEPFVAANPAAIQVIHYLGKASGGQFNLESDLNHLRVHIGNVASFTPTPETLIGRIPANQGMMRATIPAIATLQITEQSAVWVKVIAVDNFGNESNPSVATQQQAELWDDAYISNLSVSKVLAGVIQANWLLGAKIATAETGARIELAYYGLDVYNIDNIKTLHINSATGDIHLIGTIETGVEGRRVTMDGPSNEIRWYPEIGETRYAVMKSYIPSNYPNDIALELDAIDSDTEAAYARMFLLPTTTSILVSPTDYGTTAYSEVKAYLTGFSAQVNDISISGSVATETNRAEWIGSDSGSLYARVYDEAGLNRADVRWGDDGFFAEAREGNAKDGGFLFLAGDNSAVDTQFGINRDAADIYSVFHFNSSGTAIFDINGSRIGEFNSQGLIATRFRGYAGRALIQAQGGGDISFAYSGGSLFIFTDLGTLGPIKNFVIDHPQDENRWLAHGCTESPHAGVEYWGEAVVRQGEANVELPSYFESLTLEKNRNIQLTIRGRTFAHVCASDIEDGHFAIWTDSEEAVRVSWLVKAIRKDVPELVVEPLKSEWHRMGTGPYTYLMKREQ